MNEFLTFLQIIELIGKWIIALIRNYHITSAIILLVDILIRFGSPQDRPVGGFEVFLGTLLLIWYYRKRSANKSLEPMTPTITVNIDNKNIAGIHSQLLRNENDE